MNCPVCRTQALTPNELEMRLSSLKCPACGGNWISGREYWQWLENHGTNLPERSEPDPGPPAPEDEVVKDCPECRFAMVRYRVGRGLGFHLDQCLGCKGVWFDRNEWELLKERNLHDDIHAVFTAPWQAQATREERQRRLEQMYIKKFGEEGYAEIKRVRGWLDGHARKQELLAYLTDPDPLNI